MVKRPVILGERRWTSEQALFATSGWKTNLPASWRIVARRHCRRDNILREADTGEGPTIITIWLRHCPQDRVDVDSCRRQRLLQIVGEIVFDSRPKKSDLLESL